MPLTYAQSADLDDESLNSQENAPAYEQTVEKYPKVTQIESRTYGKTYEHEDIYKRLNRLELTLFHKSNSTADLSTRVDAIADKANFSEMPGALLHDIAVLEKANFDRVYKNENPDRRLERLEYHLIGAVQSGDYKNRVYKLKELDDQNSVAHYMHDNANAYDEEYPTYHDVKSTIKPKSQLSHRLENIINLVAPFLFGLL